MYVYVSELGREKLPEGTGSLYLPSLCAILEGFVGPKVVKCNSEITSWPAWVHPLGPHE